MHNKTYILAGLAFSVIAAPALAHHSFAMFDNAKTVTLNGTVKELEWTNPHGWLHIVVQAKDGKTQDWSLEMVSIRELTAGGWKKDIVKPGDKITINMHPLKDGTRGGSLMNATLASGKTLGRAGYVEKSKVPPKTF